MYKQNQKNANTRILSDEGELSICPWATDIAMTILVFFASHLLPSLWQTHVGSTSILSDQGELPICPWMTDNARYIPEFSVATAELLNKRTTY